MRHRCRIPTLLCLVLLTSQKVSPQVPGDLARALRPLLTDSLVGARRPDEVWLAADSATLRLTESMNLTGWSLRAPEPSGLVFCPGSPDGIPGDRGLGKGHAVEIHLTVYGDTLAVASMGVTCTLRANGREGLFSQGTIWKLRRSRQGWRVDGPATYWIS
jgi:hypothetical protein